MCSQFIINLKLDTSSWVFSYVEIMRELVDVQQIRDNFDQVNYLFPRNPKSKNAFLAVCYCLDKNINLHDIKDFAPYGGLIDPGKTYMDRCLNYFKLFPIHAVFLDSFGFMKSNLDLGPVYVYAVTEKTLFVNNMLLGHLSYVLLELLSCGLSGDKSSKPDQSLENSAIVSMFLSTTFLGESAYTTQTQDWQF